MKDFSFAVGLDEGLYYGTGSLVCLYDVGKRVACCRGETEQSVFSP